LSGEFDNLVDAARADMSARPGLSLCEAWRDLDLAAIRRDLIKRLGQAGIDEAEIDTRYLMRHALRPDDLTAALAGEVLVSWQQVSELADLASARLQRQPLSQVLGTQPFWTLDLRVTPDVLTPRSDTEALVEAVLARWPENTTRVLDLGTGSGAILLALLSERGEATGVGVDLSRKALEVAQGNASICSLSDRACFVEGRWGNGLEPHAFDIVVSNPPYIVSDVLAGLAPEVRDYEPALALDGGDDGLDAYREIAGQLETLLAPGGLFALEIGYDQAQSVSGLLERAGLQQIECVTDLSGNDRVLLGRMSEL
jgi:release factor glutamine methyltransferase